MFDVIVGRFDAETATASQQRALQSVLNGKLNNTDRFTLAASTTFTTVSDPNVTVASVVLIVPESSTAAVAVGAGVVYLTSGVGSFVVTHNSTADTDRNFAYAVLG